RFAARRRRSLLSEARALMLGDYHNSVEQPHINNPADVGAAPPDGDGAGGGSGAGSRQKRVTGEDSISRIEGHYSSRNSRGWKARVFWGGRCQVTAVARGLVDLVHSTLDEACSEKVPLQCAKELFRTARDILELFRAVVPVHHGNTIDSVPRMGALFHNDCLFLAMHCLVMGQRCRKMLPPSLRLRSTMVDMAPLFRELGQASLSGQVHRQRLQLEEFFRGVKVTGPGGGRDPSSSPSSASANLTPEGGEGSAPRAPAP
ncbi:unnamed protein product, partial [Discosporangium mesarthrocarpum]